jgi:hypothetical protein
VVENKQGVLDLSHAQPISLLRMGRRISIWLNRRDFWIAPISSVVASALLSNRYGYALN